MRQSIIRMSGALLLVLLIFSETSAGADCNDPVPKDCVTTKFLGEKDGCACFECNPEGKDSKTVCTKSEDRKKQLFALLVKAPDKRGKR